MSKFLDIISKLIRKDEKIIANDDDDISKLWAEFSNNLLLILKKGVNYSDEYNNYLVYVRFLEKNKMNVNTTVQYLGNILLLLKKIQFFEDRMSNNLIKNIDDSYNIKLDKNDPDYTLIKKNIEILVEITMFNEEEINFIKNLIFDSNYINKNNLIISGLNDKLKNSILSNVNLLEKALNFEREKVDELLDEILKNKKNQDSILYGNSVNYNYYIAKSIKDVVKLRYIPFLKLKHKVEVRNYIENKYHKDSKGGTELYHFNIDFLNENNKKDLNVHVIPITANNTEYKIKEFLERIKVS